MQPGSSVCHKKNHHHRGSATHAGDPADRDFHPRDRALEVPALLDSLAPDLVVMDLVKDKRVPVGIVTDRDIVIEIIGESLSVDDFTVGDIMSQQLISVPETAGVIETIRLMRANGIRRIPVINEKGGLAGIISVDDMMDLLAEELTELAKVAPREQDHEARTRVS